MDAYLKAIQEMQARVIETQRPQLDQVARQMALTVAAHKRIFLFGSGHSHLVCEEAFYRAGGLAAATPIFSSLLMLHENPALGSRLERSPGLAAPLLERYQPAAGEMLFVISNSGVNQLPLEMALLGREKGLFVVSISAWQYSQVAPRCSLGKTLDEVAHVALDNGGLPGDALLEMGASGWRVGPSSTILASLIWNCLLVACVELLLEQGLEPPIFASYNMQDAAQWNANILEKWRPHNPHL